MNVARAVAERYTEGAREQQPELCCPIDYDPKYLRILPPEILERDYGCGDPSSYLMEGDIVLDLGSGGGKICYIAAQIVGPRGRVIGVDANAEMLALARRHQPEIARRLGFDTVVFLRGHIQDLRSDLEAVDRFLDGRPVRSVEDLRDLEAFREEQRRTAPLVADESVDVVVSNCVLNLVRDEDKAALVREIYRVLRPGGRAVISDIVADEPVPAELKRDPDLWSGCISGAFEEGAFLESFRTAGFYGIELLERGEHPWRTVRGIEFRSVTVRAWKGKEGPCWDHNQAVIYRGPWSEVRDDDGHVLRRGVRTAVCEKTFRLLTHEPYAYDIIPILPLVGVPAESAPAFDCGRTAVRSPRETKGMSYDRTTAEPSRCDSNGCC